VDQLSEVAYFQSPVYMVKKPEFLESVNAVSARYAGSEKNNLMMSGNFAYDPEVVAFSQYVSQTAWNILESQGFAMGGMVTYFTEMWTQQHGMMSTMESHVHPQSQINAFYFLDAPKDCSKLVIHDPRPGKVMVALPETDVTTITPASSRIVFTPMEGTLVLMNAWLPHSLTKHLSDQPLRFVHINIAVAPAPEAPKPEVV
jgi:uncharacterized protein (TIGR02466 family)